MSGQLRILPESSKRDRSRALRPSVAAAALGLSVLLCAPSGAEAQSAFWSDEPPTQSFKAPETVQLRSPLSGEMINVSARLLVRDAGVRTRVWLLLYSPRGVVMPGCSDCELELAIGDGIEAYRTCLSEPFTDGLLFDDTRRLVRAMEGADELSVVVPVMAMGESIEEQLVIHQRFTFPLDGFRSPGRGVGDACDLTLPDD